LKFKHLVDTRTNDYFTIYKGEDFNTVDELKQLLKILNLDYAVDESTKNGKVSTRDIEAKALSQHIEFIFKIAGENNVELSVIEEEWSRLLSGV